MKKVILPVVFQEMSPGEAVAAFQQRGAEGCRVENAQGNDFLEFTKEILPCKKGNKTNQTEAARSGRMRRKLADTCQQTQEPEWKRVFKELHAVKKGSPH